MGFQKLLDAALFHFMAVVIPQFDAQSCVPRSYYPDLLAELNLAGILCSKKLFPTTCLAYGVSVATSMAAILSELMGSPKASEKLKRVYFLFLDVALLALICGLLPNSGKTSAASSMGPSLAMKKRA